MNQEIKEKWINALRSGKYRQGGGTLRSPDGKSFCCLGVLTDLYIREHPDLPGWTRFTGPWGRVLYRYKTSLHYLPKDVVKWADLDSKDPVVKPPIGPSLVLSKTNDGGGSLKLGLRGGILVSFQTLLRSIYE